MTTSTAAPFWESVDFATFLPYVRAVAAHDVRAGKHARLELSTAAPWILAQRALTWRAPCAACGHLTSIFRARRSPAKRGHGPGNIYLAATCPLAVNVGCSRGQAASHAYDAVERLVLAYKNSRPVQGWLLP